VHSILIGRWVIDVLWMVDTVESAILAIQDLHPVNGLALFSTSRWEKTMDQCRGIDILRYSMFVFTLEKVVM
jgi:hypothetical protein